MEFDENFLVEVGLSEMPEQDKNRFLEFAQKELETRIGERISRGMTEVQLNEFDMLTEKAQIVNWLEVNRPNYREIVRKTIDELKNEIRTYRHKILAPAAA